MTEPIKPALTAEEWALEIHDHELEEGEKLADRGERENAGRAVLAYGELFVTYDSGWASQSVYNRYAAAALALYGQPFGLSREDAAQLRALVRLYESGDCGFRWDKEIAWANSLADRIESLLPPEKPSP